MYFGATVAHRWELGFLQTKAKARMQGKSSTRAVPKSHGSAWDDNPEPPRGTQTGLTQEGGPPILKTDSSLSGL